MGAGAPDGTFAAGVTRVTELLPSFMNDIITSAPEDHKVCLLFTLLFVSASLADARLHIQKC